MYRSLSAHSISLASQSAHLLLAVFSIQPFQLIISHLSLSSLDNRTLFLAYSRFSSHRVVQLFLSCSITNSHPNNQQGHHLIVIFLPTVQLCCLLQSSISLSIVPSLFERFVFQSYFVLVYIVFVSCQHGILQVIRSLKTYFSINFVFLLYIFLIFSLFYFLNYVTYLCTQLQLLDLKAKGLRFHGM